MIAPRPRVVALITCLAFSLLGCRDRRPKSGASARPGLPPAGTEVRDAGAEGEADAQGADTPDADDDALKTPRELAEAAAILRRGFLDARRRAQAMAAEVARCDRRLRSKKLEDISAPDADAAHRLAKACSLLVAVPIDDLARAVGVSPALDRLVLRYADLGGSTRHLEMLLRGAVDLRADRFAGEVARVVDRSRRKVGDFRKAFQGALDTLVRLRGHDPALDTLGAVAHIPNTFVETVGNLVDGAVLAPAWEALMRDVRNRVLRNRPSSIELDRLAVRAGRVALGRIATAVRKIAADRQGIDQGFETYVEAVGALLDELDRISALIAGLPEPQRSTLLLSALRKVSGSLRPAVGHARASWRDRALSAR